MPKSRKVSFDKAVPAALRRRFLSSADKQLSTSRKERARKLKDLARTHRNDLRSLLKKEAIREFDALKKRLVNSSVSARRRQVDAFLCRNGFDRHRAQKLRDGHAQSVSKVFDDTHVPLPILPPILGRCSQWVDHTFPYPGEFLTDHVDSGGDVGHPAITSHLNRLTGQIGSKVHCGVDDAGDDDMQDVEVLTCFRKIHTTLSTGALEVNLDFEIRALSLTGNVSDEWGNSSSHHRQTVYAYIRVMTETQGDEYHEQTIANQQGQQFGDSESWNGGGNAGESRGYRFTTAQSYPAGTFVVLEVGVRNEAWFETNDMGIRIDTDADFILNRVRVRSCPWSIS